MLDAHPEDSKQEGICSKHLGSCGGEGTHRWCFILCYLLLRGGYKQPDQLMGSVTVVTFVCENSVCGELTKSVRNLPKEKTVAQL